MAPLFAERSFRAASRAERGGRILMEGLVRRESDIRLQLIKVAVALLHRPLSHEKVTNRIARKLKFIITGTCVFYYSYEESDMCFLFFHTLQ